MCLAKIETGLYNFNTVEGYKEVAQKCAAQAKIQSGAEMDTEEYRDAVKAGQLEYAMEMASRLYRRLFECDNYMYFHMQQLHLMELILERKSAHGKAKEQKEEEEQGACGPIEGEEGNGKKLGEKSEEKDPLVKSLLKCKHIPSMDPRMVFLVKLILWAQGKLDNNEGCDDYQRRLQIEGFEDFELDLMRALQSD